MSNSKQKNSTANRAVFKVLTSKHAPAAEQILYAAEALLPSFTVIVQSHFVHHKIRTHQNELTGLPLDKHIKETGHTHLNQYLPGEDVYCQSEPINTVLQVDFR